ncbi:MAG: XRE family transcriptional regulator [Acidocella sp. 20-61-6]|nr:MAG: XRE family transcriptional regulator [Acidocella sp. 20-61-6]
MSKTPIGKTIRRLRLEQKFSQQGLAEKLGISTSYLNLVEHDQRNVTASLLFKLTEILQVDLAALSGAQEREFEVALREVFADPQLGLEPVPETELQALAAAPSAARAVLAIHRALAGTREDSSSITLPSGRKIMLPNEEVRDFFHAHENHFPALEAAAETISATLNATELGTSHALAERLRRAHGLVVRVQSLPGALRIYDAKARLLTLSEDLPRESRGFQMAFQLALLEARDTLEPIIAAADPSTREAAELLRIGLLNYTAAAILMPYDPVLTAARALRYDVEAIASRFGVSYEQACHRLCTLQRNGARGVPFFFLAVDPAGNVAKRFSAAGFPFMRFGGSCPRWIVHAAFATPGAIRVQVAQLSEQETFLCFARAMIGRPARWGEPPPVRVVAMGCDVRHAGELVYGDGLNIAAAAVGIGLSCRLCDRQDCRSRAFPPIAHRLTIDPTSTSASPYRFEVRK